MSAISSPFLSTRSAVILLRTASLSSSPLRFLSVTIERKAQTPEATVQHAEARLVSKASEQYTSAEPTQRRLHELPISSEDPVGYLRMRWPDIAFEGEAKICLFWRELSRGRHSLRRHSETWEGQMASKSG